MSTNPQQFADVEFRLPPSLVDLLTKTICERVRQSVGACVTRDEILRQYGLQFDGLSQPNSNGPWVGACQIEHPLTQESVLRVASYLMASTKADPQCLIDAVNFDEQDIAQDYEMAFNTRLKQWGVQSMLYDNAIQACTYPFAISSVRWEQDVAQVRQMVPEDPETGEPLSEDRAEFVELQTGQTLGKVPAVKEEVVSDGPVVKSVYPRDFYLDPPEAQSIESARFCIERILMSPEDLYAGINEFGFDKEQVMELIRSGPTGNFSQTQTEEQNNLDGLTPMTPGYYELYICEGNFPLLIDDKGNVIREDLLKQKFIFVVCEYHDKLLRYGPKDLPECTYNVTHVLRTPNRLMGKCVTQLVQPIQEQLTAMLRLQVNIAEFASNPVISMHASDGNLNDNTEIYPGAIVYFNNTPPQAIHWDTTGVPVLINTQEQLVQYCQSMIGAGTGVSELAPPGDRTATEISTVNESAAQMRDLMTDTFRNSLGPIYKKIFTLWMSQLDETGEQVMTDSGPIQVKPIDVEGRFIFSANGNSSMASPQARMMATQQKMQAQQQYIQVYNSCLVGQVSPTVLPWCWHSAKQVIAQTGERNPERWIGSEPKGGDPEQILQQVMQNLQMLSQTDPNVAPILQGIQALMQQSMPEGQPPAGAQAQQGPPPPKIQMNFKDVPGPDQQALLQRAGLPTQGGQQQSSLQ